jgi:hypothetical protein
MQPTFRPAAVLDLLLNRDNPRHVHKENQGNVIEYLLADEEVYNLARHMSQHGINPLEVVAVFPDDDGNLIVGEGNRRICAAQLLTDPQKAPESARQRFKALAAKSRDVSPINIAEFSDYALRFANGSALRRRATANAGLRGSTLHADRGSILGAG